MKKIRLMRNRSGFSLIEVMITIAIVSVIASIIVPRIFKQRLAIKQNECRQNLLSLYEAEKKYFEKNQTYTKDLEALKWQPQGTYYRYEFLPMPPSKQFVFECLGNVDGDDTIDQIMIDETGTLSHLIDDSNK